MKFDLVHKIIFIWVMSMVISIGISTYISYQIYEPLPDYNLDLITKHDVRVELKVEFFNGTIFWIPMIETNFYGVDNETSLLIQHEYTFETITYNLTGATFNFIWVYFHVPTNIHNRFLQITGVWTVEDNKGVQKKSSKDFKQSEEIAGFFTASADITKYMFRDKPPEKVFGLIELFNRR